MNALITYFSITRNTEIIAQAIYDELSSNGHKVKLAKLKQINTQDISEYDLIFVGTACHDSDLAKPAIRFLKDLPSDSKFRLAGFVTHAATLPDMSERYAKMYKEWAAKCETTFQDISESKNIEYLGYFHCMGKPSPPIAQFVRETIIHDETEWQEYIEEAMKHPDENDLVNAQKFAKKITSNI